MLGRMFRVFVTAMSVVCVQAEAACVPRLRVCWRECCLRGAPAVLWLVSVGAAKWVVYLSFGSLAGVASDTMLHLLAFLYSLGGSVGVFENPRVCFMRVPRDFCGSFSSVGLGTSGVCECVCARARAGVGTGRNLSLCAVSTSVPVGVFGMCCVGPNECQGWGECVWGSVSGVDVSVSVPVRCVAKNAASVGRSWAVVECGRDPRVCVHV